MKKGFSALELLIIVAVVCFVLFFAFKGLGTKSVVNEHKQMTEKQEVINNQLKETQKAKNLRDERLKQVLERNY